MKLEFTLLRTRVARRMLALFLLCAVVPIVALAAITYPIVVARLEAARVAQLHDEAKDAGMLMLAQLERLGAALQRTPPAGLGADSQDDDAAFTGVAIEQADGRVTLERGRVARLPALSAAEVGRLSAGRPVLLVDHSNTGSGVYLVAPGAGSGHVFPRRWGYLAPSAVLTGLDLVPDGIDLCVGDPRGPLACNAPPDAPAAHAARLTDRWSIFLKGEFGAPAWSVTVTQRRADALAPLAEFRRSFLLGLVFAIVLVFVLSHVQIRRRMTPLADLEAGTQRLSNGDFSSRVVVESDDEFQSLGEAFNQMASDLERQFTTLSALHEIDRAALQDHSIGAVAAAALRGAPGLLGSDVVAVAIREPGGATAWRLEVVTTHQPTTRLADVELPAAEIADLEIADDHLVFRPGKIAPTYCLSLEGAGPEGWVVFPIRGQRGPIGALIAGIRDGAPSPRLLTTGRQLGAQLALGLSNVSLLEELDSLSLGALTALARTIDAASHWTAGHSERVTLHAVAIGEALGVDEPDIVRLRHGSLLHDIGKIGVPATILDKPGRLTDAELAVMQSHPAIGARIVESVRAFCDLVPLVLHHHELLNGTGYPDGLQGDAIPLVVRILTVADVFDALTSDRPYRKGLSAHAALAILTEGVGTKFDRRAVTALRQLVIAESPVQRVMPRVGTNALFVRDEQLLLGATQTGGAA